MEPNAGPKILREVRAPYTDDSISTNAINKQGEDMALTKENARQWAKLLLAIADGKYVEVKLHDRNWIGPVQVILTVDMAMLDPERYRIVERGPKPTQEWLDERGFELTGEYRPWKNGDHFYSSANDLGIGTIDCKVNDDNDYAYWSRWILRKKEPAYRPYEDDPNRAGGLVRMVVILKHTGDRFLIGWSNGSMVGLAGYGEVTLQHLFERFTFLDGTPCGVRS